MKLVQDVSSHEIPYHVCSSSVYQWRSYGLLTGSADPDEIQIILCKVTIYYYF